MTKIVRDLCRENDRGKVEDLIRELYKIALTGKTSKNKLDALKYLVDRVAGKPTVMVAGEDGGPIQFSNVDMETLSDAQLAALVALRSATKAIGK